VFFSKNEPYVHDGYGIWSIRDDGTGLTWVTRTQVNTAERPDFLR
jgi:hypothetical protein